MSFRDLIGTIAPPWLQRQWGERYLYTAGLELDAIAEAARQGVRARAPGAPGTPSDALVQIGRDRVIVRGGEESEAGYSQRLSRAFDSWSRAASLEGILRQLQGLLRDESTKAKAITYWGTWATIPAWDAAVEYLAGYQSAWTWGWQWLPPSEGGIAYWDWAQVYAIVYPAAGQWTQPTFGAGLLLGASGPWCLGVGAPYEEAQALRTVADQWRSAATRVRVIVSYDAAWPSDPLALDPDAVSQASVSWRINHKRVGGVAVPSRYLSAAYLDPVG